MTFTPSVNVRRNGAFQMIIVDRHIVIASRKRRSKWWTITCACPASRRRKDGSCKHQRWVLDEIPADLAARTRVDPVRMGDRQSGGTT